MSIHEEIYEGHLIRANSWTSALAQFNPETEQLQMHPEVAEALDRLNIG